MALRGLRLALQFLTRLPVPGVEDFSPADLARSATWFPVVGLVVGGILALLVHALDHRSAPLAGIVGVLAWVWLTGALHLDGLADLADALGASHRDRQRFLAVLEDPHAGTFGIVAVVLVLMLKAASLALLASADLWGVPLILAWARLGTLVWSLWLKPLKAGHGERFAWQLSRGWVVFWTVLLLIGSAALAPVLCAAPLVIVAWGGWLQARLGGMTGDCLGAGVEVTETALVLLLALTSGAVPGLL
ncbi:MAG TPA: adenosylcobinamide-GDP ribazoletransferase [Steroidobacteraceae bacterium]|nr:adenosylcobinamide-GDP ribazoletransferase [Steroidobacteraceae bacterium]